MPSQMDVSKDVLFVGVDCHLPKRLILEFWNGVWFLQTFETVKRLGS